MKVVPSQKFNNGVPEKVKINEKSLLFVIVFKYNHIKYQITSFYRVALTISMKLTSQRKYQYLLQIPEL